MSSGKRIDTTAVGSFKRWSQTENREAAQKTYQRVQHAKQTGDTFYMERLDDKDTLFGAKGTRRRSQLESSLSLFTPQKMGNRGRAWSPQINDAWLIGHLEKGNTGELASPPTTDNMWSSADNRPTATGREVLQTLGSGYSAVVGNVDNALGSRPMFMTPLPDAGRFGGVQGINYVDTMSPELQRAQLGHLGAQFQVMEGHDSQGQILKDQFVTPSISKRDAAPFPALYAPGGPLGVPPVSPPSTLPPVSSPSTPPPSLASSTQQRQATVSKSTTTASGTPSLQGAWAKGPPKV